MYPFVGLRFLIQAGSNTVAMFAINPSNPAQLKMIGQPIGSGGDFPMSLTISKQTGQVCVLNGGTANGVKYAFLSLNFAKHTQTLLSVVLHKIPNLASFK